MALAVTSVLEDTLYEVKSFVEDNFSAYLEAMDALKGDGLALDDIKVHVVGDLEALKQTRYPMAFYYPMEINVEQLDLGNDEIQMQMYVSIVLKGADGDKVTTKALRYSDCLREMVNDDHTLGGACDYARVSKVNYYASEPGTENLIEIESILSVLITVTNS
jgi:hypothetical protein